MNGRDETFSALQVVVALFQKLNEQGVSYCHWKSTYRLPQALGGQTDLDILVGRGHGQQFREIVYHCGLKPVLSDPRRQFPAIEDYLGFDTLTGGLVHLHVHYRLVLGEQRVKNYCIPLENSFLENTQIRLGVKVPAPELEIVVLVLRALLKYRDQDVIRDILGVGRSSGFPPAILDEFEYLLEQTSYEKIARVLDKYVGFISPDLIFEFLITLRESPRAGWSFSRLRGQVRRELRPYQRYRRLHARLLYYRAALARQWLLNRLFHRFFPGQTKRKIPVTGGLTVAFVGADGAGKSTVIRHLAKWLSWRLNVCTYYMGKAQPSFTTKTLKSLSKLMALLHAGCRRGFGEKSILTRTVDGPKRFSQHLRYIAEGLDRYSRYRAGRRKAAQGSIVIYDRYPLNAICIFNRAMDGPIIASKCNGHLAPVARKLSQVEETIYQKILPAEQIFLLHVRPDVARSRKPGQNRELIEAKSQAIEQIARDGLNLIDVDTDQPFDRILLQIKSALWGLL
jgi:thymidylate kinase